ncbi:MAG: helix-turn-helix domain-containing protein [Planctomycetes bacterium]|nr:helix-turn-helix domain-containing protein [Planctomycetota bacterium]
MNVRPAEPGPESIALRVDDAARAIGVSGRHLRDFIKTGELPAARLGTAVVVLRSDLIAFLEARRTASPTAGSAAQR